MYAMTERPEVVVTLKPTDLNNLLSPQYKVLGDKLVRAHEAAPRLVENFIAAATQIEQAWQGGDLAGAVRQLIELRDEAESFRV